MKLTQTNKRILQIIISIVITAFMIYVFYHQYGLAKDVVNQASLEIKEGSERLDILLQLMITFTVISVCSVLLSNFEKHVSLVVSIFPIVGIIGCSYMFSGSIATFGFPWLFFIPVIYLGILIFYDFYLKRYKRYKVSIQVSFKHFKSVNSLILVSIFIFIVTRANLVYQANILFGEPGNLFYHFLILMFSNYLILGFSCLVFIINKKIGVLLSIFPISLHQIYYYLLNYHFSEWINIPWEFYLSFLFASLYIWSELQNYRNKNTT